MESQIEELKQLIEKLSNQVNYLTVQNTTLHQAIAQLSRIAEPPRILGSIDTQGLQRENIHAAQSQVSIHWFFYCSKLDNRAFY